MPKKNSYNAIGLDEELSKKLIVELNEILASYHIYYQNLRGFHWNIKGKHFFELHLKFEELYNDALLKIDALAERILTLGGVPFHTFEDYIKNAAFKEVKGIENDRDSVEIVAAHIGTLVLLERNAIKAAQELGDEGTTSLLTDDLTEKEKLIWMLNAWLN
jgi:starvation-inducible DNA-binding protein